jgi:hypothetical protein
MSRRRRSYFIALAATLLVAAAVAAQTPQDWMKRILDPAKIGVTLPPGAVLNKKLSVDYISKTDPPKEMAIYMMPLDQLQAASQHFAKALGVEPKVTGAGSMFEIDKFDLSGGGSYPKSAEGLTITISRSQFVDNRTQITMEYMPKK